MQLLRLLRTLTLEESMKIAILEIVLKAKYK